MDRLERRKARKSTKKQRKEVKEEWRRYGAARRKELVAKDELVGGLRFEMHKKCQIENYYRIAEKVMLDFKDKCKESNDIKAWEESYVMGHRLKAFLGKALPQHPHYRKPQVAQLRLKNQKNIDWIKEQMQEIALKIDEDQLNTYITMDFEPEPNDLSSSSSSDYEDDASSAFADFSSIGSFDDDEWHDFNGWSKPFPDKEVPIAAETDSSSRSNDVNSSSNDDDSEFNEQPSDELNHMSDVGTDEEEEEVEDPETFVTFQDEDDESMITNELDDGPSNFFKRISDEVVSYESDSEAVDSWAQDGESHAHSCASSGTGLTYDPARIAFRELMNKLPRDRTKLLLRNNNRNPGVVAGPGTSAPPRSILMRRLESKS